MAPVDVVIVLGSLAALVVMGGWLASRQRVTADFYLGGRRLPSWSLGLSLAANQASAISLIGAPAFIALREGGGLSWLQYELAVPLAMAVLVVWGVPLLRRAPGANVYAAVEGRLGGAGRRVLALLFLVGRGAGAGVVVYASALVVSAVTPWTLPVSLAVVAGVAVAYTTLGGLAADVITDVVQLALLWGGTVVACVVLALRGDVRAGLGQVDPARLDPLVFSGHGLGDGATFAFWPMLLGGLFLYISYYGCDQTQAQRILSAATDRQARTALTIAGLVRFPLVLTYCLLGVLLAGLLAADPAFAARLVGRPPDALVPEVIAWALPAGVRGIAVAAILAAALSSVDSALNSLSAVTMEELIPGRRGRLLLARATTFAWGVFAAGTAWLFSHSGETTIEAVNRVGSALYGPILAVFALAYLSRRADGRSAVLGALTGVAGTIALGALAPGVSWLWWNPFGFGVTWLAATALGRARLPRADAPPTDVGSHRLARLLAAAAAGILAILAVVSLLLAA